MGTGVYFNRCWFACVISVRTLINFSPRPFARLTEYVVALESCTSRRCEMQNGPTDGRTYSSSDQRRQRRRRHSNTTDRTEEEKNTQRTIKPRARLLASTRFARRLYDFHTCACLCMCNVNRVSNRCLCTAADRQISHLTNSGRAERSEHAFKQAHENRRGSERLDKVSANMLVHSTTTPKPIHTHIFSISYTRTDYIYAYARSQIYAIYACAMLLLLRTVFLNPFRSATKMHHANVHTIYL